MKYLLVILALLLVPACAAKRVLVKDCKGLSLGYQDCELVKDVN